MAASSFKTLSLNEKVFNIKHSDLTKIYRLSPLKTSLATSSVCLNLIFDRLQFGNISLKFP